MREEPKKTSPFVWVGIAIAVLGLGAGLVYALSGPNKVPTSTDSLNKFDNTP